MLKPSRRRCNFCAWWTILTSAVIVTMLCCRPASLGGLSFLGVVLSLFGGFVGMVGAITTLVMLFAMSRHVFAQQQYSTGAKAAWVLLFFLALPVGAAIYHFLIFRRVENEAVAG